jgi:hypothetical protein
MLRLARRERHLAGAAAQLPFIRSQETPVTSILQIEANRRNAALRLWGQKRRLGKRTIRMNALKHQLTAQHVTLFDERLEDFQAFHAELRAALKPKGAVVGGRRGNDLRRYQGAFPVRHIR